MKERYFFRFKLRRPHAQKFFWVYIYDSVKDLRADATSRAKKLGRKERHHNTLGVVHPYVSKTYNPKTKKWKKHDDIGIIRLAKKHIGGSVIVHETGHAAFWEYRLKRRGELADFGKECSQKEEELLHMHDQYFRRISILLYRYGFWH